MNLEEYEASCVQLFNILASLNESTRMMSDWEKSQYVYDYIIEKTVYEWATSDEVNKHEGSSFGSLVIGRARCQGYANAYELCMWAVGIECYAVTGDTPDARHAWNVIRFGENYYLSDVTWDDRDGKPTAYRYLNVSTVELVDHTLDEFWTKLNMPTCDKMDMSLFEIKDSYITAAEDLKTEFFKILDAYYTKGEGIYFKLETKEQYDLLQENWNEYMREWAFNQEIGVAWTRTWWNSTRVIYLELTL